jgi:signal peptidase
MLRWGAMGVFVALVVGWLLLLRPQALGGATAYIIVAGGSMHPVLYEGDVALVRRQSSYRKQDVIVYRVPDGQVGAGTLVIHRVIGGSGTTGYVTRGDNTGGDDAWRPRSDDVVGKVRWKLPLVGRMLVFLRTPLGMAAFAALVAFALAFPAAAKRREAERPASP